MNIFDTLFGRPGSQGHWDNVGAFGRLHTRTLPQMGCYVCEAEGWIPASKTAAPMATCQEADRAPDLDSAKVRLSLAVEDLQRGIDNITLAIIDDPRLDEALDLIRERLRGIRAALESEVR